MKANVDIMQITRRRNQEVELLVSNRKNPSSINIELILSNPELGGNEPLLYLALMRQQNHTKCKNALHGLACVNPNE
jgi:hypothetical protein